MDFIKIFGNSVRVKVLEILLSEPNKIYSQSEISRKAGCSVSSVGRALEPLAEAEIIKTLNFKGQVKIVMVNKENPIVNKLIDLRREMENYGKSSI